MRLPTHRGEGGVQLSMTPLIDVVFLLMIFFLWTSSFDRPEFDLETEVARPAQAGARSSTQELPEDFDELIIRIRGEGNQVEWTINTQLVTEFSELIERLTAIAGSGAQPPVVIDPEAAVSLEQTVRTFDAARGLGFERVMLAVKASDQGQVQP
jgi:biopolymer transport protein ExbD